MGVETVSEVKAVKGTLHPVVHTLAHWLQAWQSQRQAEGQAMILARALVESGFISGAEVHNGVVFSEGTVRSIDDVLNSGNAQLPGSDRPAESHDTFMGRPIN
jgi:hypothetical protein